MAKILIDAGLKANIPTLSTGELYFCIDTNEIYIGSNSSSILLNNKNECKGGLSAYKIWLQNNNTGSEEDFLNSLIGPKGDTGAPADENRILQLEKQLNHFSLWSGTQTQYDIISEKDTNTIYFIID